MIFKNYFRVCKKIILIEAKIKNIFVLGVPKVLSEGVNKIFLKTFHRGIRNQKFGKVKKFQVWVA